MGELLQRDWRRGAGQHLLLDRQRADRENRLFLRTESLLSGQRLRGGGTTGTLLGNPDNPVICRHVHCVAYNPAEDAFYACTGDRDRAGGARVPLAERHV